MIDLNPDSVIQIAENAREFQAMAAMDEEEQPEIPDLEGGVETPLTWRGDPKYLELKTAIEDLEPDQQATLVALMWLGRGDYELDDWRSALAYANEVSGVATADYLIATPLLADYLLEGLSQHGYDTD